MFDDGSDLRFEPLVALVEQLQWAFGHGLDFAAFGGDAPVQPGGVSRLKFGALFRPGVARVGVVRGGGVEAVDEARSGIHPDVRFHPEIPLLAIPSRVHIVVAGALCVLGVGRRGEDRGVHDGALAHEKFALFE